MRNRTSRMVGVAAGLCLSCAATAASVSVIFSNVTGAPSNAIPGMPGTGFFAGTGTQFERPYRSPDGLRWVLRARGNLAAAEDQMFIVGSGATSAGATVIAREGTAAGWDGSVNIETLGRRTVGINNNGDVAFSANTNGATTSDEHIVRRNANGTWDVIAREGNPTPIAGGVYGTTLDGAHILNNGDVGFVATALTGLTTATNAAAFRGGATVAQKGVTIPGNQAGGATNTWENFSIDEFYSSADGAHYMLQGDTNAATTADGVIVVDGNVVIQEGQIIAGSGFANPVSTTNRESFMMSNGDWFARGSNATDNVDWVVRNGSVIAQTGGTITGSTTERWSDTAGFTATFFWMGGDNFGNYVVGGVTDAANTSANAVFVLNGATVLVREGDMVDINGDGLMNDDAFISVLNNDDGFLDNNGTLFFTADLRDGLGTSLGQAFMTVQIPAPGGAALLGLAGMLGARRRR